MAIKTFDIRVSAGQVALISAALRGLACCPCPSAGDSGPLGAADIADLVGMFAALVPDVDLNDFAEIGGLSPVSA